MLSLVSVLEFPVDLEASREPIYWPAPAHQEGGDLLLPPNLPLKVIKRVEETVTPPEPEKPQVIALNTAIAKPTPPPTTPVPTPRPPVAAPADLEPLFNTYASAFNVEANKLKAIANCESHFNPGANSGLYGGMYQFSASTWASTRNAMGQDPNPDLRFSAEEAIETAAFKIAAGGIRAWPVCGKK